MRLSHDSRPVIFAGSVKLHGQHTAGSWSHPAHTAKMGLVDTVDWPL